MQWDDLRYVLAVHRSGSLAGAARSLHVSHVTVARRIDAIEKALGVRLFDRKRDGYRVTDAAAELVERAEQVEEQINALERRAWRENEQVRGTVRLTVTDTVAATVLPGMLRKLHEQHPQLTLEVTSSDQPLNITKHDADIAIRYTTSPPEMLIGHLLTPVRYAVYGAADQFGRTGSTSPDFAGLDWVGPEASPPDNRSNEHRFNKWLREHGHEDRVVLRCNSFVAIAAAIRAGAGIGIMSCFTAGSLGGLVRLSPVMPELDYAYWILTHPELRDVARVATVYAFLRNSFAEVRPLFTGNPD